MGTGKANETVRKKNGTRKVNGRRIEGDKE